MLSLPLVVLLPACAAAAATPTSELAPAEVELSIGRTGAVRVPVTLDGHGPFRLLLDTGSSHTTLGRELAERLALPMVAQVKVTTPAGVEMQPVVRLRQMAIGSASLPDLRPSVVSLAELARLEPGIEGVVGQDFLGAFDYTIDYRRKRLRFAVDPTDPRARLPLIRAGNRSLVQLAGGGGQASVLMVPDTGSEGFVIFEREGRTAVKLDQLGQLVDVSALAMRRPARAAVLRELKVGPVTLRDQPAVIVARERASAVEADGLLPLHRFSAVAFSNSEAYLVVRR